MSSSDFRIVPSASGLGPISRVFCLLASIGLTIPVVVAFQLTPEPGGIGTHQQLGLPPCSIRLLYGIRCPACGMTTSWAHLTRMQVIAALSTSVAGTLFGLITTVAVPTLAWMSMVGKGIHEITSWGFAIGLVLVLVIALIEWIMRIA